MFLDERHAVGITACRGYVASYRTSGERLNSWGKRDDGVRKAGMYGGGEKARGPVHHRPVAGNRILGQPGGWDKTAKDSNQPGQDVDVRAAGGRERRECLVRNGASKPSWM